MNKKKPVMLALQDPPAAPATSTSEPAPAPAPAPAPISAREGEVEHADPSAGATPPVDCLSAPSPVPGAISIFLPDGEYIAIPVRKYDLQQYNDNLQQGLSEARQALIDFLYHGFAHTDPYAVVIQNDIRYELTRLVGRTISNADDLVRAVRALSAIRINDPDGEQTAEITLTPELLARIVTRCHNQTRDPESARAAREEVVKREVLWALERFTNLR
jgi:hypothetical protein